MRRVLRARDLKAHEAREREERWESDKEINRMKQEEEALRAKEEQKIEKVRLVLCLVLGAWCLVLGACSLLLAPCSLLLATFAKGQLG